MSELTEMFVGMVARYATMWHNGRVPEDRVQFVARILEDYMPESSRTLANFTDAEWMHARDDAAAHLVAACDCLARTQAARWTN